MILGHEDKCRHLAQSVAGGRASHAYLFGGLQNLGKATIAREFMRHLLCRQQAETSCAECDSCLTFDKLNHPDAFILGPDESGRIDIESVRNLRARLFSSALVGSKKVALLDGAELLTASAASTLLKILEEPPSGTHIIIITHRPEYVLPTVRSRTRYLGFSPVQRFVLATYLKENKPDLENAEKEEFLDIADGRPGVLMTLLAQDKEGEKWEETSEASKVFLTATRMERLAQIEHFPKEYLTRDGSGFFLARLVDCLRQKVREGAQDRLLGLKSLIEAQEAIMYNTSPRLVLEWLALQL